MLSTRPVRAAVAVGALAALTAAAGCDSTADEATADTAVTAVASTGVWAEIVQSVGGPHVTVDAVIGEGTDPHEHQSSALEVLAVRDADLVVVNGGGYDGFMTQILGAIDPPEVLIDVSALPAPGPAGDPDNEHLWFDPATVEAAAEAIADGLTALDPAHSAQYADNLADFTAGLDALQARLDALAASDPAPVLSTEPVLGHLLAAAGVPDLTPPEFGEAVEHGTDPSPAELAQVRTMLERREVAALVYNTHTENPTTEAVRGAAEAAGVPVIEVSESLPTGMDYLTWTSAVVDALEQAVGR